MCVCVADVLSEEAILKWYTEGHLAKGKSVFLEQMKKFVEWLKNAEEGKSVFIHTHTCEVQFSVLLVVAELLPLYKSHHAPVYTRRLQCLFLQQSLCNLCLSP